MYSVIEYSFDCNKIGYFTSILTYKQIYYNRFMTVLRQRIRETIDEIPFLRGKLGGINMTPEEDEELKKQESQTVQEFIDGFKNLIIHICLFKHEDPREHLLFQHCLFRTLNLCCGHPRVIMAKFFIAISILYKLKIINNTKKEELEDIVWSSGDILWNKDARIAFGYRGSLER